MQAGQALGNKNGMQPYELQIPAPSPPLTTFYLQFVKDRHVKMFKGAKVIGVIFQNRTGRHIHRMDSISMVWEYDRAFLERRKYLTCHPLDRNRPQMQYTEGLSQGKVNAWWVNWEEEMIGIKDLQLGNGWEDIDRILHPPTNKFEGCEGRKDLEVSRL